MLREKATTGTADKNRRNETGRSPGDGKWPGGDALTRYPDDGGVTRCHGDGQKALSANRHVSLAQVS